MKTIREANPTMEQLLRSPGEASTDPLANSPVTASSPEFPELDTTSSDQPAGALNQLLDVTVCVTAELGRVTMTISDILKLGVGSVVGLPRGITESVDLLVQGVPFARGDVVVVDDCFAIRIREIVDPRAATRR